MEGIENLLPHGAKIFLVYISFQKRGKADFEFAPRWCKNLFSVHLFRREAKLILTVISLESVYIPLHVKSTPSDLTAVFHMGDQFL